MPQYFEFQVDKPATFIADAQLSPRPAEKAPDANLIQFVVDTSGNPELVTFKVLSAADTVLLHDAYATAAKWRFVPATLSGRKVCQIFQTPVER